MGDDELLATISEIVLGYREGEGGEILQALIAIKSKAMQWQANHKLIELLDKIDELALLKEKIMDSA